MNTGHTPESLRAFEADIAAEFNAGRIRAPIHLSGGNEDQLLRIFDAVREKDWIATTWRSHYACLLKGVPPDVLKRDIMTGRSITLTYPAFRIVSSAIVGGVLPIALGLAWAVKRACGAERVWAFVGDMTAAGGMFHECRQYARGHALPITFVIEDNGTSVCTDTRAAWGAYLPDDAFPDTEGVRVMRYGYGLPWPHSGAGQRVNF